MKRTCKLTGEEFEITPQEVEFMEKKMGLPLPLYSPKVREISRMGFRNDRNLYMRNCDATGERILSVFSDAHEFPVYKYDYWITDEWTPPEIDFDPDKDFFEQFAELDRITPHVNLFNPYNENCDYVNAAEKNKNCYMHILADRCEDCYYTHGLFASRDCIDCAFTISSELCYECTDCRNCYHCRMCFLCDNSSDLSFCFECRGCKNCFGCSGLKNQEYCFENKQLSKDEYEAKIAGINFEDYEVFEEYKKHFIADMVEGKPYRRMINNQNSDGNFLINTKNCHKCFDIEDAEDCFYVRIGSNHIKDVHHCYSIVDGSQLIYGNISTTESYNCHNMIGCWTTKDSCYGLFLQACSDCIGCISLRRKKYCILNKQYSKSEYETLKAQIIEKMGEEYGSPFPIKLAPFNYQDSVYSDYYEMSRQEVEALGWKYGEKKEIDEKNFKIIEPERKLLHRIGAPLPKKHYDIRWRERVRFRKEAEKLLE